MLGASARSRSVTMAENIIQDGQITKYYVYFKCNSSGSGELRVQNFEDSAVAEEVFAEDYDFQCDTWYRVVLFWEEDGLKVDVFDDTGAFLKTFDVPGDFSRPGKIGLQGYECGAYSEFDYIEARSTGNSPLFTELQTIPTQGATAWEPFAIDGADYLAVANLYDGDTYNTNSVIYRWNGKQFVAHQSIPTAGAMDWECFTVGGDTYLVVANMMSSETTYNIPSKIYKWNGQLFIEYQSIDTSGAADWEFFTIGADSYLVVANMKNGPSTTRNINSVVYKWDGDSFEPFQNIPTHGARDWEHYTIDGTPYLAVANAHNDTTYNIDSEIFKWDGASFASCQAIATHGARDWESFVIGDSTYLALANGHNDSTGNIDSQNLPVADRPIRRNPGHRHPGCPGLARLCHGWPDLPGHGQPDRRQFVRHRFGALLVERQRLRSRPDVCHPRGLWDGTASPSTAKLTLRLPTSTAPIPRISASIRRSTNASRTPDDGRPQR